MGFWRGVEDRLLALQADRVRTARLMLIAYWISTAFVLVGVAIMMLVLTGVWKP